MQRTDFVRGVPDDVWAVFRLVQPGFYDVPFCGPCGEDRLPVCVVIACNGKPGHPQEWSHPCPCFRERPRSAARPPQWAMVTQERIG